MALPPDFSPTPTPTPGPLINSLPTTLTLLSPHQLRSFPHLPHLTTLINTAFATRNLVDGIFSTDFARLQSERQIFAELGPGEFFTCVVSSAEAEGRDDEGRENGTAGEEGGGGGVKLHATATARVYSSDYGDEKDDEISEDIKKTRRSGGSGWEGGKRWELKFICVDPALQGRGLASMLLRVLEAEIVRRWVGSRAFVASGMDGVVRPKPRLLFLLETLKETNHDFYAKRGFVMTEERRFEAGVLNTVQAFEVAYMEKDLLLDWK